MYEPIPEESKPQIQFACFTSETEILVHHALIGGNWEKVVSTVLAEVKENQKLSINYQDAYHIHYLNRPPHTFFAVSDSPFSRALAFTFLREIEEYCAAEYVGPESVQEAKMFLATKMNYYNANQDLDKVAQVRQQIEEVNEIMLLNIEKALNRGEKVEILTDKTKVIKGKAQMFRLQSKTVKHFTLIRNNPKKVILIISIILLVLIVALALYCEGQSWHDCFSSIF